MKSHFLFGLTTIVLLLLMGCSDPTPPSIIVKPTKACPPGAFYIPDQGCTVPLITPVSTPTLKLNPTATPTATPEPQSKLESAPPLIVWLERDPWRMVIGSDSPAFALYEDGQVIYLAEDELSGDLGYVSVTLSETELAQLLGSLAIDEAFFDLDPHYEVSDWTDQPTHTLLVRADRDLKQVQVYGDVREDAEVKSQTPRPFREMVERLSAYAHPHATPWLPLEVEIMVWPYDTSGAFPWPETWPDLEHPTTWDRGENSYSLYLTGLQFEQFREIIEEESPSALLINNKKWAYGYRYPFPNEHYWMGKSRP